MAHPATTDRVGPELVQLRQRIENLAKQRKEALNTCHVLAGVALCPGPVQDLMQDRQLTVDRLLDVGDKIIEPRTSTVERAFGKAVELARRMGFGEAGATHLLMAVLSDAGCAGRRRLEHLRVDVAHLRSQAWNLGLGWPRRKAASPSVVERTHQQSSSDVTSPTAPSWRGRAPTGVTIPLFPPNQDPSVKHKRRSPTNHTKAQCLSIIPERRRTTDSTPADTANLPGVGPRQPAGAECQLRTDQLARVATTPRTDKGSSPRNTEAPLAPPAPSAPSAKKMRRGADRFELDAKRFATLNQCGRNLTLEAARNQLDEVLGRDVEIEQTLDVLAKCRSNSPCLVGPAGVGKTSIVRGLALRIARQEIPSALDDRIVIEISVGELLAGTGVRGALAQRISALRQEVKQAAGRVVVFFDEIHLLFGGDAADESASELKLALGRGEFPCIGATTAEDYRSRIEADPALARRFTVVDVEEPSREQAFLVLEANAQRLAHFHGVRYSEQALALGIGWSVRYLPGRMLPDKAISIADLAGARARRRGQSEVTAEHMAEVVAAMASIPVERLLETDAQRLLALEQLVAERVVGHFNPIHRICRVLRRNAAGLGANRPIGTFLLLGPTGVGKTETAKAIAAALFHSESAMTRLDMAEYSESHAVAKLIGAPPGYVGHDAGGQLTEAVRKRAYQVVLLDEIEKAHNDVLQAFLSVFDEGRLTDSRGRTVDFRNTIIVMTSNLGSEHTQARPRRRMGFSGDSSPEMPNLEELVIASARARLSPELYNRIDECLVFEALKRDEVEQIAQRLLERLVRSLGERDIALSVTPAARCFLVDQGGFDATLGARPMKRVIARLIEAPLAEKLLAGLIPAGASVTIDVVADQLEFDIYCASQPDAVGAASKARR